MQPVVWDGKGVIRFQENEIVRYLLDHGGLDLNKLHGMDYPAPQFKPSDWEQFHQLIGYSVSGCPYLLDETQVKADDRADALLEKYPSDPGQQKKGVNK